MTSYLNAPHPVFAAIGMIAIACPIILAVVMVIGYLRQRHQFENMRVGSHHPCGCGCGTWIPNGTFGCGKEKSVGRALRGKKKPAIILDFKGNGEKRG